MDSKKRRTKPMSLLSICLTGLLVGVSAPQETITEMSSGNELASAQIAVSGSANDAHFFDISDADLMRILDDPKSRVSAGFRVPDEAKPIVGFWLRIYAKYSLHHIMIYDRDHHDKIYEVVDGRDLFMRGLSPVVLEITMKERVKRRLAAYTDAFKKLRKNRNHKFEAGSAGTTLVKLWGRKTTAQWRVIEEALRTQAGQRDRTMQGLANADRFFPSMESIFRKFGIPTEITRLPMVESSFNVQAISKVDAVGVWQFLEKSAMEYLVVDQQNKIDERLSPIKSTYAAAKMFKRNYSILKDWGLAIIAYNHGAKNLIPIRKQFTGDNIARLLHETKKTPLGYASRSFYACFLAMLHAEKYRDQLYGMSSKPHSDAISIVRMKKPVSVFDIAGMYNISIHELRVYNPDIFDLKRRLPAGTRVVLPRKVGESIVLAPQVDTQGGGEPSRNLASPIEFIEYIR